MVSISLDIRAGRRARRLGTGKDVWEVVAVVRDNGGDATESARYLEISLGLVQAAIAWVLAQPDVTSAIVGASSAGQLRESLPATEVSLDADEMQACNDVWFDLPRLRDPEVALR